MQSANPSGFVRLPKVEEFSGLSRAEIYRQIRAGKFPKQIKLSKKSVGWLIDELVAWRDARAAGGKR
jgi:prophage regulatory protein